MTYLYLDDDAMNGLRAALDVPVAPRCPNPKCGQLLESYICQSPRCRQAYRARYRNHRRGPGFVDRVLITIAVVVVILCLVVAIGVWLGVAS